MPDRHQMPFSARWRGYIEGEQLSLVSDQQAILRGHERIEFRKAWEPHASLTLLGASELYPHAYSANQVLAGKIVRVIQDLLAVAYSGLLLLAVPSIRIGWPGVLFLGVIAQGYARTWPLAGRTPILAGGQDWLTYESQARDILAHGWLLGTFLRGRMW